MTHEEREAQITRITEYMSHAKQYRFVALARERGFDTELAMNYLEKQVGRDWNLVGEVAPPEDYVEAFAFERFWGTGE